jgi:hypothetical protein
MVLALDINPMGRSRNAYRNKPRNTDTRLTALADPSAPCFILTPANPARAVSTVVAHSPIGKAEASALPLGVPSAPLALSAASWAGRT